MDSVQHDLVTLDDFIFGEPTAVPEPSTWAMMLLGFVALGIAFRRQHSGRATTAPPSISSIA
jgi:hypothetical protein